MVVSRCSSFEDDHFWYRRCLDYGGCKIKELVAGNGQCFSGMGIRSDSSKLTYIDITVIHIKLNRNSSLEWFSLTCMYQYNSDAYDIKQEYELGMVLPKLNI